MKNLNLYRKGEERERDMTATAATSTGVESSDGLSATAGVSRRWGAVTVAPPLEDGLCHPLQPRVTQVVPMPASALVDDEDPQYGFGGAGGGGVPGGGAHAGLAHPPPFSSEDFDVAQYRKSTVNAKLPALGGHGAPAYDPGADSIAADAQGDEEPGDNIGGGRLLPHPGQVNQDNPHWHGSMPPDRSDAGDGAGRGGGGGDRGAPTNQVRHSQGGEGAAEPLLHEVGQVAAVPVDPDSLPQARVYNARPGHSLVAAPAVQDVTLARRVQAGALPIVSVVEPVEVDHLRMRDVKATRRLCAREDVNRLPADQYNKEFSRVVPRPRWQTLARLGFSAAGAIAILMGVWGLSYMLSVLTQNQLGGCSLNPDLEKICPCNLAQLSFAVYRNAILHESPTAVSFMFVMQSVYGTADQIRWSWLIAYVFFFVNSFSIWYILVQGVLHLNPLLPYALHLVSQVVILSLMGGCWNRNTARWRFTPLVLYLILLSIIPGVLGFVYPALYSGNAIVFQSVLPIVIALISAATVWLITVLKWLRRWSMIDQAVIGRLIATQFEALRVGGLVATADIYRNSSSIGLPFFAAIIVQIGIAVLSRNQLHIIVYRRLRGVPFSDISVAPFRRITAGVLPECELLVFVIMCFYLITKWSYASYLRDCNGVVQPMLSVDAVHMTLYGISLLVTEACVWGVARLIKRVAPQLSQNTGPTYIIPEARAETIAVMLAMASMVNTGLAGYATLKLQHVT